MCQSCRQKVIGKVLSSSNPQIPASASFYSTGQTKQMISPLTGQLTSYTETFVIHVTEPALNAVSQTDLNTIRDQTTTQAVAQGHDVICDTVLCVQGTLQDTYKTRTWVSDTSLSTYGNGQTLIAPLVIIAIIVIIGIIIAATVVVVVLINSFMEVANKLLPSQPGYVGGDPNHPQIYDDFAKYLSAQTEYYCLVCPKCGAGFAPKADYLDCLGIPAELTALYNEHVKNCLGIPQTNYSTTPFFVWAIIGIGGGLAGLYIVYKIIASRHSSRD